MPGSDWRCRFKLGPVSAKADDGNPVMTLETNCVRTEAVKGGRTVGREHPLPFMPMTCVRAFLTITGMRALPAQLRVTDLFT